MTSQPEAQPYPDVISGTDAVIADLDGVGTVDWTVRPRDPAVKIPKSLRLDEVRPATPPNATPGAEAEHGPGA